MQHQQSMLILIYFCAAVDAVVGSLPEDDVGHDFLGPVQPDVIMRQVAEGESCVIFSDLCHQKRKQHHWLCQEEPVIMCSACRLPGTIAKQCHCSHHRLCLQLDVTYFAARTVAHVPMLYMLVI